MAKHNNKGVGHWKKRKAIAMYLNRRQSRASFAEDNSNAFILSTESNNYLTTEDGFLLETEVI